MPESRKWNSDELSKVASTPWDLHQPKEPEVVFKERVEDQREAGVDKIAVARQVYIKASDLDEFGLTRGCPRCDHQLKYGPGRTSKPHSQQCRARIMGELAKTVSGQARIKTATARLDESMAEHGEQHRTDTPQGDAAAEACGSYAGRC